MKHQPKALLQSAALLHLLHLLLSLIPALAAAASLPNVTSGKSAQISEPRVAFACSNSLPYPAMVWSGSSSQTLGWRPDSAQTACYTVGDLDKILAYCKAAYPEMSVANVAPAPDPVTIGNWCPIGSEVCPDPLTVVPYLCIAAGRYESPSLLVPNGCRFGHKSAKNPRDAAKCAPVARWKQVATESCARSATGWFPRSHSYLLPCNSLTKAGFFAGVEYVCCPPADAAAETPSSAAESAAAAAAAAEEKDKQMFQEYLSLPSASSSASVQPESERYSQAMESLRRYEAARESRLERQLSADETRVLSTGSQPAVSSRMLTEISDKYRRLYASLQREESAEEEQLDSVHQQRVTGELRRRLTLERRLIGDSLSNSRREDAARCLAQFAGLIGREAARVANRANWLATKGSLTPAQLAALKQHLATLAAELNDTSALVSEADKPPQSEVAEALAGNSAVLVQARRALNQLSPSSPAAPPASSYSSSDAEVGHLAERFAAVLRRHSRLDEERLRSQERQLQQLQQHQQHLQQQHDRLALMPHRLEHAIGSHGIDESDIAASSSGSISPGVRVVLGCLAGLLLLGLMVAIATGSSRCRRWRRFVTAGAQRGGSRGGAGYKLTLVDDTASYGAACASSGSPAPGQQQPSNTASQQQQQQYQHHLATMQMNGYENPTYKFYEN